MIPGDTVRFHEGHPMQVLSIDTSKTPHEVQCEWRDGAETIRDYFPITQLALGREQ